MKKYIHPQKKPLSSTSQSFPKANNLILSDAPACCLFLLHANHYYCTLCVSSSQCPLSIDTFIRCSLIIVFCRTSTYTQTITTTLKRAGSCRRRKRCSRSRHGPSIRNLLQERRSIQQRLCMYRHSSRDCHFDANSYSLCSRHHCIGLSKSWRNQLWRNML